MYYGNNNNMGINQPYTRNTIGGTSKDVNQWPKNYYGTQGAITENKLGEEEGNNLPEDMNWEDFASSSESESNSWSGLPDWASDWLKGWWDKFQKKGIEETWGTWQNNARDKSAIDRYSNEQRGYIEKARQLMPQQYMNQMNLYNQRATNPVLNKMSSRGILNSSVTGGALSDVLRDTQSKYSDKVTEADLWAANQGYDLNKYLTDAELAQNKEYRSGLLSTALSHSNMLPQLLQAMRESTSSSKGSSFGGLLELLLGGM